VAASKDRVMYRRINPSSHQELSLRMLFQPTGQGLFQRACEADGFRGLVAAILDDPAYEISDVETRLVNRLRLADDIALMSQIDGAKLAIGDRDGAETINVASDESFIHSLDRLGFVSLGPSSTEKQ
jgi:hypothetical protein